MSEQPVNIKPLSDEAVAWMRAESRRARERVEALVRSLEGES